MTNTNPDYAELFKLFEEMINGHLQPGKLADDDCSEIDKVLEEWEVIDDAWTHYEYIFDEDFPKKGDTRPKSKEKLNELLKNIPFPPSDKAEKYLIKIGIETKLIKSKAEAFNKDPDNAESYEKFALQNITRLRLLADQLRKYIQDLGGEHLYLFTLTTNHFIAHVLKIFIIDLIQFIQRVFDLEINDSYELRMKLFEEDYEQIELSKVIPFLPKETKLIWECEAYISKILDFITVKVNKGTLAGAEELFKFYKVKYKHLDSESRLKSFQNELRFWEAFKGMNCRIAKEFGEILNDPNIGYKMIPLLQKEIEFLENVSKIGSVKSKYHDVAGLRGFACTLSDSKKKSIFEMLINFDEDFIDQKTKEEDFLAMLKDEPLPQDFRKVKWTLMNRKKEPHKTALRDFLTLVLGKAPNQKMIDDCITDGEGLPIKLAKPKVASNYSSVFEGMVKM